MLLVQAFAGKLEGYDAADIRVLLDRALHAALRRSLSSRAPQNGALLSSCASPSHLFLLNVDSWMFEVNLLSCKPAVWAADRS